MKNQSIEERIKAMNDAVRDLENIKQVIEWTRSQLKWFMPVCTDENGERIIDENGEYVRKAPSPDDYDYESYCSWKRIIDKLENIF